MKYPLRRKSSVLALGIALTVGVVTVQADGDKPVTHHHRHHAKAEKAEDTTHRRPAANLTTHRFPTADGRNSENTEGNAVGVANGPEYRVPTGSHIPQRYNRRGTTTDNYGDTTIIDHNDQRFQQQDNVSDILRTVPGLQVRGGR